MNPEKFSIRQLIELDACTRCGECLIWCPISKDNPEYDPKGHLDELKSNFLKEYSIVHKLLFPKKPLVEEKRKYSESVYQCTLCGECNVVCPVKINLRKLHQAMRSDLVTEKIFPAPLDQAYEALKSEHNIVNYPNMERASWLDYLESLPEDRYQKKKAEVAYFVGCMASFSPAIQDIPMAFVEILQHLGIDFTILGEEEWCCGFPLFAAGMLERARDLIEHNKTKIKEIGVKTIIFNCPSCYHMWKNYYQVDVELLHSTQFLAQVISEGKLKLKEFKRRVTYHDPCDLGRNSKIYEEPRTVIKSIPGIEFTEIAFNREKSICCGGGGDLEITNPDLVKLITKRLMKQVMQTEAEVLITACQQCKRAMKAVVKEVGKIEIKDLIELINELKI